MKRRNCGENTTHDTRAMAHEVVDKQRRYKQIVEILDSREMTAKELAVELMRRGYTPSDDRNFAAPRLTELTQKGIVEPIGRTKCKYTGKTVAVYALVEA